MNEELELCGIVTRAPAMRSVLGAVWRLAVLDEMVLIEGETGTGKSLVARALHALSARAAQPFVTIECGSLPESLIDSELWGYERGAFTGANRSYPGRVEAARGGTLFLDEINSMSIPAQVKLLHFLAEGEFHRVGCQRPIRIDVRVIAAANEPLADLVAAGRMRPDFYHRVNVFRIALPPLRERREDLPLLVDHFLRHDPLAHRCGPPRLSDAFLGHAARHDWPGNIRELLNRLRREIVLGGQEAPAPAADGAPATAPAAALPAPAEPGRNGAAALEALAGCPRLFREWMLEREREYLTELVRRVKGAADQAAVSGLPARTLYRKLRRLRLTRGSAA